MSNIKLFISHSHDDEKLADRLISVIKGSLEVPSGAIRCSSVRGYKLDLGELLDRALQKELRSAVYVVALLTPNSLTAPWVLFELGAAWGLARSTLPLLAGGLEATDLPGPLQNVVARHLGNVGDVAAFIEKLHEEFEWPERSKERAVKIQADFARYSKRLAFRPTHVPSLSKNEKAVLELFAENPDQTLWANFLLLTDTTGLSGDELEQAFVSLTDKEIIRHVYDTAVGEEFKLTRQGRALIDTKP